MFGLIKRLGIRSTARAACQAVRGGGPVGLRLVDVHPPEGFIVPTVTLDLELPLRSGPAAELSPGFPLPPPLAWTYRVGKLGSMVRDRVAG
jgi:hypothetical protein